jgi:anti-anti-sigma factor
LTLYADPTPASTPDWGPGLALAGADRMPVISLSGSVDRDLAGRADSLLQLTTLEHEGALAVDVSAVEDVNGALLGLLLRASRRLAWRNRQLVIVCRTPETLRRLEIAGLDELATLTPHV